jgi:hypothetical protein
MLAVYFTGRLAKKLLGYVLRHYLDVVGSSEERPQQLVLQLLLERAAVRLSRERSWGQQCLHCVSSDGAGC